MPLSPSFRNHTIKNQPKGHSQKEEAIARHQREKDQNLKIPESYIPSTTLRNHLTYSGKKHQ